MRGSCPSGRTAQSNRRRQPRRGRREAKKKATVANASAMPPRKNCAAKFRKFVVWLCTIRRAPGSLGLTRLEHFGGKSAIRLPPQRGVRTRFHRSCSRPANASIRRASSQQAVAARFAGMAMVVIGVAIIAQSSVGFDLRGTRSSPNPDRRALGI
jgi:hypothetical protein